MKTRPAGTTAAIASMLVVFLGLAGVELTQEASAVIIGGLTALVSLFYPLEELI